MDTLDPRSVILGNLDIGKLRGLEIGPLHNPLVLKSDGDILYVDHADSKFIKRVNAGPMVNPRDIVDIDIVWGDRPLKELAPHPVDYVVACHVIEHVPDVIGWLMDLHGALVEEGLICLAAPDRRFMFDLRRPESTAGEMVEAYLTRARRPPARHLFDQVALQAAFHKSKGWEDDLLAKMSPEEKHLASARSLAERVTSTADYVDAHCWVFTPESFLNVAAQLSGVGLFPFEIDFFQPTRYGQFEFYVRLRKSTDAVRVAESIRAAREILKTSPSEQAYREMLLEKVYADMLPEPVYSGQMRELAARKADLEHEQRRCKHEIRYLQGLVREFECSTSWRLTWPIRWLGRLLRRR